MLNIPSFEWRIALHSSAPERFLRALDRPGLALVHLSPYMGHWLDSLARLRPHVVITDLAGIGGREAYAALSRLPADYTPRLIALGPGDCPADARLTDYNQTDSLPDAVERALSLPLGCLALPGADARQSAAAALLHSLGIKETLLGYACALQAAQWLSALPGPHPPARYWLYPLLSARLGASPAAIERRLRIAIEDAWLLGDWKGQGELFGFTVSSERGKPTNMEFLCLLAEHVRVSMLK